MISNSRIRQNKNKVITIFSPEIQPSNSPILNAFTFLELFYVLI